MEEIPPQLGNLLMLETINLSHNMLFGSIRSTFENGLSGLTIVNVSFNQLEGPIPNTKGFREASCYAFQSNKRLCGNTTCVKACKRPHLDRNTVLGNLLLLFILIIGLFTLCQRCKSKNKPLEGKNCERIFGISGDFGKRFYQDIIKATDEFNSNYCIGTGGHRHVDKAVLLSGQVVVVKKLHLSKNGELTNVNAFEREGSSRAILNNEKQAMELDWFKRVNVVKGTNALSYMHHFGTTRFLKTNSSSLTSLAVARTLGYMASVLTLEIIRGNHPDDLILTLASSLSSSLASSLSSSRITRHTLLSDVANQRLQPPRSRVAKGVVSIVQVAFACLHANP
ncbi:hypothetical protein QQP08_003273 [Theobroma cacao]|nr:hypothetical protein QQP08_003273 [Theobroma cacao]